MHMHIKNERLIREAIRLILREKLSSVKKHMKLNNLLFENVDEAGAQYIG